MIIMSSSVIADKSTSYNVSNWESLEMTDILVQLKHNVAEMTRAILIKKIEDTWLKLDEKDIDWIIDLNFEQIYEIVWEEMEKFDKLPCKTGVQKAEKVKQGMHILDMISRYDESLSNYVSRQKISDYIFFKRVLEYIKKTILQYIKTYIISSKS